MNKFKIGRGASLRNFLSPNQTHGLLFLFLRHRRSERHNDRDRCREVQGSSWGRGVGQGTGRGRRRRGCLGHEGDDGAARPRHRRAPASHVGVGGGGLILEHNAPLLALLCALGAPEELVVAPTVAGWVGAARALAVGAKHAEQLRPHRDRHARTAAFRSRSASHCLGLARSPAAATRDAHLHAAASASARRLHHRAAEQVLKDRVPHVR